MSIEIEMCWLHILYILNCLVDKLYLILNTLLDLALNQTYLFREYIWNSSAIVSNKFSYPHFFFLLDRCRQINCQHHIVKKWCHFLKENLYFILLQPFAYIWISFVHHSLIKFERICFRISRKPSKILLQSHRHAYRLQLHYYVLLH